MMELPSQRNEKDRRRRLLAAVFLLSTLASVVFLTLAVRIGYGPSSEGSQAVDDQGEEGPSPSQGERAPLRAAAKAKSGLEMIRGGTLLAERPATPEAKPGAGPPAAGKSQATSGGPELSQSDAAALRSAGGSADPKGTQSLGATPRALWSVTSQLAKHPKVLGFLLNNKLIVSAYMNRPDNKEACSNPKVMANFFTNTHSEFDAARDMARANPEAARVAFSSELFKEIANCPGMQGFAGNQSMVMGAVANPSLQGLLSDPAVLSGLTSNSESAQVFGSFQKAQAGP